MKVQYQPPFAEQLLKGIYSRYSHKELAKFLSNQELDFSLGCMFGSFTGDSIGSYLEFNTNFTKQQLRQALDMTPGGTFNLRAGQVTDDSQMSFHLLEALSHYDHKKSLKEQRMDLSLKIALGYVQWKKSKPFDIGNTTRGSIKVLEGMQQVKELKQNQRVAAFDDVLYKVAQVNHVSQSNGSLMRITPMIFFLTLHSLFPQRHDSKSEQAQMLQLAQDQIRMVHPNPVLVECSMHWIKTLFQLSIRKSNAQIRQIYQSSIKKAREVLGDWADEVNYLEPMPATDNIGWAKIAWSYGMRQLNEIVGILHKNPDYKLDEFYFERVMASVLERGGDTDTNLAIVGGLIGALVGFKNLPSKYIKILMEVDYSNKQLKRSHDRPSFYEPRTALCLAFKCFQQLRDSSLQPNQKPKPKV